MTDIVERLRRGEHWPQAAADEIERLRAGGCVLTEPLAMVDKARAALEGK